MLRRTGAVLAGFLAFEAVVLLCLFAARTGWPAYAEAEPTRAYDLLMLLVRLTAGSLAAVAGGAVAARADRGSRSAALAFGTVLLVLSVVWHIRIWDQYPVWYHLGWWACIVPFAVLGGHRVGQQMKIAEGGL
ncbi:hypothetical protein [Sphingomonas sp. SUN039]|uniref:hypothetical protein n=1 Tax=Sphingomonas sp. SUN039 TaxID=2937787 RepID=UPI0021649102|nr:hypothetical protein [Sphingomonas sp. SUN039]UVO54827.1 hypothetical protein M0209_12105 [Sphingomonas sp. SUN039]